LKKGFPVVLQDTSYKIDFFNLHYECDGCDILVTTIRGDSVTLGNAPILKHLKAGEILRLTLFKIDKRGKSFTIPQVSIILTD